MADILNYPVSLETRSNGLVARLQKAWADYVLYSRTVAELQSLSNRELQDLGLSRHTIREVARDSVYGA